MHPALARCWFTRVSTSVAKPDSGFADGCFVGVGIGVGFGVGVGEGVGVTLVGDGVGVEGSGVDGSGAGGSGAGGSGVVGSGAGWAGGGVSSFEGLFPGEVGAGFLVGFEVVAGPGVSTGSDASSESGVSAGVGVGSGEMGASDDAAGKAELDCCTGGSAGTAWSAPALDQQLVKLREMAAAARLRRRKTRIPTPICNPMPVTLRCS